jgi:23S rRNA pseudouridine2605 synthase
VRLQKYLSRAGVASRRAAEEMIRAGRVRVNGDVVTEMGTRVETGDQVEVDGRPATLDPLVWVALHKPRGYVTTRADPQGRPTVYDLLPAQYVALFHVGRLDQDSEGLLLLTNDGEVANRLLHPSRQVDRVYVVDIVGAVGRRELGQLLAGVQLEDGMARAHDVEVVLRERAAAGHGAEAHTRLRIVMREGRKREVRRMFDAFGYPVRRLVRERLGPIELGTLGSGEWRELRAREVAALRAVE